MFSGGDFCGRAEDGLHPGSGRSDGRGDAPGHKLRRARTHLRLLRPARLPGKIMTIPGPRGSQRGYKKGFYDLKCTPLNCGHPTLDPTVVYFGLMPSSATLFLRQDGI